MTADPSRGTRGVDIDLLADYAGGALDGTPEREQVRHLVATDPAWAAALDDLRAADVLVRADLASVANTPIPMPPDVAARIDRALADVPSEQASPVVSLRARRRRYRRAAVAAVAAGVVGIAGYAWYAVAGPGGFTDSADSGSRESAAHAPAPEPSANRGQDAAPEAPGNGPAAKGPTRYPVPVSVSGRNYTRDTVTAPPVAGEGTEGQVRPPRGLERLASPTELQGCLRGIGATYTGSVDNVDYARFEDEPALIVIIRQSGDGQRVVVVGPDCRSSGADEKYTVAG